MSKINEVIDSLNNENAEEVKETLKSEASALNRTNSDLYKRAKKAEGFEYNRETKEWIKKEVKVVKEPEVKKAVQDELDYGQKAFLVANGVKGEKALKLAEDYLAGGRFTPESLIDNKYFQNELKDLMDDEAAKTATPEGGVTARGGSAKDTVDYYLKKNEMPPDDKPELRKKYVAARYKKEKSGNPFGK